ncbi:MULTISPECIES: YfcE family phosphodiesterase [Mammaliicoccus]|uniref:Phosphoesterase n=1 Tax=Mammaliicoccus vitulinus TaxID=71237 RepID=A0A2T4PUX8_9STAP|nr:MULTISPECIES: metallophosphoesterase [Mammaliicoccus]PTI30230.1 YfcE family phosphodiesterase [Mammaliicoccus vitulinus]PTI36853.1 YfcE family phosphodiesterase [Mammaliicoccus vitulinus]PTI71972.1 YfcE family phosphodiesterase [Mammaliicoccus vitulinus]PTI88421.1 YfcE family phosphodiesterase [Mammaliicoccus vitulinus]QQT15912.1 metallophosphoesterase [Mammaliicoccus vitulinus]
MKWIVVSDNHGEQGVLHEIYDKYREADLFLHLGDSEFDYDDTELSLYQRVKGNCDFDPRFPIEDQGKMQDVPYFFTHGHRYEVKGSRNVLSAHAKNARAKFAFYGHSHVALCELIDGVYCINPGSISQTRGRWEETYAMIEFDRELKNASLTFLNRKHEEIDKQILAL